MGLALVLGIIVATIFVLREYKGFLNEELTRQHSGN